ncbi:AAA family ATPase [Hymenobacter sp. ASUV-10]|uniref:AAA family ATPase n=1 Tax=Hymenobacter aranciens TaxID=3063996 RepID=A0ABT9B9J0_9BACT|nr:AAA family ATPase [Hymenobacter sp. ASUV-10]MDO7874925.1 AAA family ATPase [Hymenobacter sp. ASUV-10]
MSESAVPRLTYLRIKNYRALRDVEFRDLTPLTMLIGPNGSGKSTVLDALAFLAEAVGGDLKGAWERRNRFAGMRTRGGEGSIEFEITISLQLGQSAIKYELEVDEKDGQVYMVGEAVSISDKAGSFRYAFFAENYSFNSFTNVTRFIKRVASEGLEKVETYESAETHELFKRGPLIQSYSGFNNAARNEAELIVSLLTSYRNIHLTDDHLKGYSDAGPRERLSPNGDNLPNVLYYLHEKHPDVLEKIAAQLRRWVPGLADIVTEITSDERLLLRFKDAPFEKPLPAQYMSGGTMRLAALLTLLYEPNATGLLGMEEPDNELHPLLLYRLAEELGKATETRQLLVTTHSPMLLDALAPEQVWILHRDAEGYTQATRTADIPNVPELVEDGSPLGYLWTSNAFHVGNPLAAYHPRPDAR